jgi:lipopolysaccharide export LptBFGC system permease protein LptF
MKAYQRTLVKQYLQIVSLSLLLIVIFVAVIDLLANLLKYLGQSLTNTEVLLAFISGIPHLIVILIPFACLFGTAYLFGTLIAGGEIMGFMLLGYTMRHLLLPIVLCNIGFGLLQGSLNEIVAVYTDTIRNNIMQKVQGQSALDRLVFRSLDQRTIFYAKTYNPTYQIFHDIIILQFDHEQNLVEKINVKQGLWQESSQTWLLTDSVVFSQQGLAPRIVDQWEWHNTPTLEDVQTYLKPNQALSLYQLAKLIQVQKQNGFMSYLILSLEFWRRITNPLIIILLALFPAIRPHSRQSAITLSLVYHIILMAACIITQMIFGILAKNGSMHALLATTLPLVIISILLIYALFYDHPKIQATLSLLRRNTT